MKKNRKQRWDVARPARANAGRRRRFEVEEGIVATVPDMQELGSEQKKALNRKKGPVLLLSGAGSGKTTVLAHRYAQLYKGSKRPTILLLCPGASAARRMRGAVEQLTGPLSREWVVSFREAACRLLREQIEPGVRFTVWDDCDRETLVRGILKEFKMHEALFKGISAKIASLKARRITPERLVADQDGYGFDEKLARVYARYQDELRKNAALDLDDLVNRVVELLENDDDLKDAVTGSFDHILVDDLQDLTPAQYAFLKVVAGSGKGLYAAGDDDQDIVRSRMGKPEIISTFKADFPNAAVVQFSTNYRCTDPLLCAARTVIEKGAGGAGKTLKAFRSGDQLPVYSCTGNETEEAHHIAYLLKDLYLKDKYAYGDMAVLYRVPQQGKVISDVLRSEGIPIRTAVGPGFFSHPVVKDAVAYLRLLLNPGDDLSFERILNRPHRGVGDGTIARLRREAKKRDISLFETVAELSKTSKSLKKAGQLVKVFKKLARKLTPADDVVPLLRSVLETSGYADWILEQDGEGATAARRLGDLMALAEGMCIVDFVDRAALWSERYEVNHGDGVRRRSVHQ